jgi:hypothetical protein
MGKIKRINKHVATISAERSGTITTSRFSFEAPGWDILICSAFPVTDGGHDRMPALKQYIENGGGNEATSTGKKGPRHDCWD